MPIPPSPFVTFVFTGLVALCFGNNNEYGQFGFHNVTDDHELRIIINKKQNQTVIGTVATYKISHEMLRNMPNMWVDIEGPIPPIQQTVEKYISSNSNSPPLDDLDFRRVVDFEGTAFYNRQLTVNPESFSPSIFFAKGLFFAAHLTERQYITTCVDANGMPVRTPGCGGYSLGRVADEIGVNLYTDHPSQSFVIRVGKDGRELFRLRPEAGVTYEIRVDNGPTPETHRGDHFTYYYDGINLLTGEPRIILSPLGADIFGVQGGSVCAAGSFGKRTSIGNYP